MSFEVVHKRRVPGAIPPSRVTPPVRRPMTRAEIADGIAAIKEFARRLRPPLSHRPHQFHEDKSELVKLAERLEDAVRGDRALRGE
jgi:hypothetical protein